MTMRMMRGRGGNRLPNRGSLRPPFKSTKAPHSAKQPFDLILAESFFPRVQPLDDECFQNVVINKLEELVPTETGLSNLTELVAGTQKVFDSLILSPNTFSGCQIEESRQVGSFKKGTMLRDHKVADVVVILQTLPFQKTIEVLATRVLDDLKKTSTLPHVDRFTYRLNEHGFEINGLGLGFVRILIGTVASNYSRLVPNDHLSIRTVETHALAIKHTRWFEENAGNQTVRNVVRLLRDLKKRNQGFSSMTPWMIDLLAYHSATMPTKKDDEGKSDMLQECAALRRALQLMAAGVFLIGTAGLQDPCDNNKWIHNSITYEQQDVLCLTAQNLVRILAHGGILPIISGKSNIATAPTMWQGVVVNPLSKAYERPTDKKNTEAMDVSET